MLEIKRIEALLPSMKERLRHMNFMAHLAHCRQLIENGWTAEFDAIPFFEPLKTYVEDPLQAILVKLYLLKFLFVVYKNNPAAANEIPWVKQMREQLTAKFANVCALPDQQVGYNGIRVLSLSDLETLAAQRNDPRPLLDYPAYLNQNTAWKGLAVVGALAVINMLIRYLNPENARLYLMTSFFLFNAMLLFGSQAIMKAPHINYALSDAGVQNNLDLQKHFLISTAELKELQNPRNNTFRIGEFLALSVILKQFGEISMTAPTAAFLVLPPVLYGLLMGLQKIPPVSALLYNRFFAGEQYPTPGANARIEEEIVDDPAVRRRQPQPRR